MSPNKMGVISNGKFSYIISFVKSLLYFQVICVSVIVHTCTIVHVGEFNTPTVTSAATQEILPHLQDVRTLYNCLKLQLNFQWNVCLNICVIDILFICCLYSFIHIMEWLGYCEVWTYELAIRRAITLTQQLSLLNTTWFADYQLEHSNSI